jgi:hypothetical protein
MGAIDTSKFVLAGAEEGWVSEIGFAVSIAVWGILVPKHERA